ncbi:MAG TPA: hypothetical protein VF771_14780 [Longimicrobiaceae bacterium]
MRTPISILRLGAAALAVTLAACEHTPLGTQPGDVVGAWSSGVVRVTATTPDGQRSLERVETWWLLADGSYRRQAVLKDPANGKSYTEYVDHGTYEVPQEGVLDLTPAESFRTTPLEPSPNPVLQPGGWPERWRFGVRGDVLELGFVCPPDALCVETPVLPLHRVPPRLDQRSGSH